MENRSLRPRSLFVGLMLAASLAGPTTFGAAPPVAAVPTSAVVTASSGKNSTHVVGWERGDVTAKSLSGHHAVRVTGPVHRVVKFQKKVNGHWRTVRVRRTSDAHKVGVAFLSNRTGTWRIKVPSTRHTKATTTAALRINAQTTPTASTPVKATAGSALVVFSSASRPYSGDYVSGGKLIVTTPNAVYSGYQFDYLVEVRAPGVVFRNCAFRGTNPNPSDSALLYVRPETYSAGQPSALVEDSTLIPSAPNNTIDGVRGSNFTLRRVEITKTVDGVHIHGTSTRTDPNAGNVTISGSWIHDLIHYNDTSHSDGSHNDGVQIVGGSNITVTGNRFDGTLYTSAFMIAKDRNEIANVNISNNRLAGGWVTINVADKTYTPVSGLVMNNNVFTRGTTTYTDFAMLIGTKTRAISTAVGNTWHDNSTPLPYMHNGG